jgi:hypothetical protein
MGTRRLRGTVEELVAANRSRKGAFTTSDRIWFYPDSPGKKLRRGGEYLRELREGLVEVILDGDPFAVSVRTNQIEHYTEDSDNTNESEETENMATATANKSGTASKPNGKQLRQKAAGLNIPEWETMSLADLRAAVLEAEKNAKSDGAPAEKSRSTRSTSKSTGTKASSTKATSSKSTGTKASSSKAAAAADEDEADEPTVAENGNPYKEGTNLWHFTEELLKGGKRSAMVKRLAKKVNLRPTKASDDFDEAYELDRRLLITGQGLRKLNWDVVKEGRDRESGTIQATPPA